MEERRSNGFRVKPSFGQVLGYITEGEPLDLPLPNRKASIYTSSHFYLDDYPNAPEPISDAPRPQTTINPAAAFETADEGYDGVPFPRPPRSPPAHRAWRAACVAASTRPTCRARARRRWSASWRSATPTGSATAWTSRAHQTLLPAGFR